MLHKLAAMARTIGIAVALAATPVLAAAQQAPQSAVPAAAVVVPKQDPASVSEGPEVIPRLIVKEGLIERNFAKQPPLIPHSIEKYQLNQKVNQCLRCHGTDYSEQEKAPVIPVSHFRDREGKKLEKPANTRWFCTQCHVTQLDAKPIVGNSFKAR